MVVEIRDFSDTLNAFVEESDLKFEWYRLALFHEILLMKPDYLHSDISLQLRPKAKERSSFPTGFNPVPINAATANSMRSGRVPEDISSIVSSGGSSNSVMQQLDFRYDEQDKAEHYAMYLKEHNGQDPHFGQQKSEFEEKVFTDYRDIEKYLKEVYLSKAISGKYFGTSNYFRASSSFGKKRKPNGFLKD